ncbi:MAG: winged helix-turn-helix domain-containing protein [Oligoflexales bacterium]
MGGFEKLFNDVYMGRASCLDAEQIKFLGEYLSTRVFTTTRQIVIFVESEFRVQYTIGGMISLLDWLGFSYKKGKGVPAKSDATAQQNFIKEDQKDSFTSLTQRIRLYNHYYHMVGSK